jgi:hypothetical protein
MAALALSAYRNEKLQVGWWGHVVAICFNGAEDLNPEVVVNG